MGDAGYMGTRDRAKRYCSTINNTHEKNLFNNFVANISNRVYIVMIINITARSRLLKKCK